MKRSATIFLLGSGALAGVAVLFSCIQEHARPVVEGGAPSSCGSVLPGTYPPPNCDPSDNSCPNGPDSSCPTCGQCNIDPTKCGDPTTCMPLADNSAKTVYDFRLRRLFITSPAALTTSLIEGTSGIITQGVDLASPSCGDPGGKGAFNWLLRVDPTGSITTGGAPPSPNPYTVGYCFYRHVLGGLDIEPSNVAATFDAGMFTTATIPLLNVPVFLNPDAGAGNANNVIILPLRNAQLTQTTLSNKNNCIGSFNGVALDDTCIVNDPSSCSKWHTAGSLGAVMTLEDADTVSLSILPETLCVLLTGMGNPNPNDSGPQAGLKTCARDSSNKIVAKGDYCSSTNKPGDCQDAFWLSATFAASAVIINNGASDPTCQGTTDGGTDAPSDAPTDAPDAG